MMQLSIWDYLGLRSDAGMPMASEKAWQASHDANDAEGHAIAAEAHKSAMEKAAKNGNTHMAEMHARMAAEHGAKASQDDDADEDDE